MFTTIFSDTFSHLLQEVLVEAALINLIEPSIDVDQLLVEGAVKGEGVGDISNAPSTPPSSAHPAPALRSY